MKILCLEQFRDLGGGQLTLLDLLPGFRERGWEPVVAIPGEGLLAQRVRSSGFEVDIYGAPPHLNDSKRAMDVARYAAAAPKQTRALLQLVSRRQPDLLYVNASRVLPLATVVASRFSIPLVFHCHNRVTQPAAVALLGLCLKLARALVISCCRYSAKPFSRYLPERALSVIYNGVREGPILQSPRANGHPRIAVIGRIEPEKGQLDFVTAAHLLVEAVPDCKFFIAGAPLFAGNRYLHSVQAASRGLALQFLGWQDDVRPLLSTLDLLVVPSAPVDSAPRVILEAFAARVPVVAFPSGGIPELIQDGHNGFLTSAFTPAALAERIRFVLQLSPAARHSVIVNGRNCWRERHSLDAFRRSVSDFLARAVAPQPYVCA
jgi:glycosyltransferase involved in cell wall biosynthesis